MTLYSDAIMRARKTPATLAAASLIFALPLYAYTDPGSGALLLQLILASVAGAAFYFRRTFAFLARRLWRKDRVHDSTAAVTDDQVGR